MKVDSRPGEGSTFTFRFRAVAAPAEAIGAADLRDARVLTLLGSGIVKEQLLSLLKSWAVQAVVHAGDGAPAGEVDAVIVDADASGGALRETLSRNRESWGLDRVPVITIVRLHPGGNGSAAGHGESFIATPVRKQALHDALAAALRRSPAAATERVGASLPAFDGSRLAVLLVEDNESNRHVVALMLSELGLHADQAAGGYDAIDRAGRRRYDVILMDVQMPDIDGLEAARRIRADEHDRHATIIALTANVLESDEARCRAAGMDGYLQKPLTLETLSFALRSVASPLHK
jgi:CheY-like chemotaxis protein